MVKNLPASAGDARDTGSIPESGSTPLDKEMASQSGILAWRIPWTEEPGGLQSMGFSRQEYWSGLPFPSPRDLPDPGIEPGSSALQADSLPAELLEGSYMLICVC